jgi:hypothetical protein
VVAITAAPNAARRALLYIREELANLGRVRRIEAGGSGGREPIRGGMKQRRLRQAECDFCLEGPLRPRSIGSDATE